MAKVNWINGNINPPHPGEYYVIQKCLKDIPGVKAGQYEILSDWFSGEVWSSLGPKNEYWSVVSWAEMLLPDIPKDLQGKVHSYFDTILETK